MDRVRLFTRRLLLFNPGANVIICTVIVVVDTALIVVIDRVVVVVIEHES